MPFLVLPATTQGSLLNLAFASGVLQHVLQLDNRGCTLVPATIQTTFSFHFLAHPCLPQVLVHNHGQVGIDAVFMASRHGKPSLFVVEAKSNATSSLGKHKLLYASLAARTFIPDYFQVVPVYIRVHKDHQGYHFRVAECEAIEPHLSLVSLTDIRVTHSEYWILPMPRNS